MSPNITIIGMADSFKKEVSRTLANKLDKMFVDINEMLIYNFVDGSMLDNLGQKYFDESEKKVVSSLLDCDNIVINSNISTINKEENLSLFKEKSVIVYLRLTLEQFKTINKIENCGEIVTINEKMFNERDRHLQTICDICVETDELSANKCVENLMLGLKYYFKK